MTPTLRGRWQTRLLLNLTVGVVISLFVGWLDRDIPSALAFLGYMTAFGLVWDIVYIRFQSRRWDHDWSPMLYLVGAIWEFVVILALFYWTDLPRIASDQNFLLIVFQYLTISFTSFIIMFGPMRIFFPRWRFRGGQWL